MAVGDFGDERGADGPEALTALKKATRRAMRRPAMKNDRQAGAEDALGTTGVERVASVRGVRIALSREIVGWGRSHGLLRFRCKSLRAHLQCC